jgi:hypothetical protein
MSEISTDPASLVLEVLVVLLLLVLDVLVVEVVLLALASSCRVLSRLDESVLDILVLMIVISFIGGGVSSAHAPKGACVVLSANSMVWMRKGSPTGRTRAPVIARLEDFSLRMMMQIRLLPGKTV